MGVTTPSTIPGIIEIDSDGSSCSNNQDTVSASGSNTQVQAVPTSGTPAGEISLFALATGATTCSAPACDAGDVAGGRLMPQPVSAAERATRAPVDWRYNCKAGYPTFHGIAIANCGAATPPYIDGLKTAVGASGNPSPSTYQRWTTTGHSCNPSGTTTVTGNWWVDCSGGLSIGNGTTVTFSGGNVVFDGGLSMTGGALNLNSANPAPTLTASCRPPTVTTPCLGTSSSGAAFAYVRAGDWNITGGVLTANHVAVYQAAGYLKVAGGAPPTWLAPTEGPFASLALWSEQSSNKFQMNGGAGVQLSGVFFTPEATPFSLAGGGNWGQLNAVHLLPTGGERRWDPGDNARSQQLHQPPSARRRAHPLSTRELERRPRVGSGSEDANGHARPPQEPRASLRGRRDEKRRFAAVTGGCAEAIATVAYHRSPADSSGYHSGVRCRAGTREPPVATGWLSRWQRRATRAAPLTFERRVSALLRWLGTAGGSGGAVGGRY